MLISEETIENINLIIQAMFNHNRTLDRALGFMDAKWAFANFNRVFHKGYAHLFPIVADFASDILLRYNIAPKYYETITDVREYADMLDFFETNVKEHIETYELIKSAIKVAQLNDDINVEADLKKLMRIWNEFMNQAIVLRDKAEIYKDNKAMFDGFCEQFYTLSGMAEELEGNK